MQKTENKILIIGAGAYGIALMHVLKENKHNNVFIFGNNINNLEMLLKNKSKIFEDYFINSPTNIYNSYEVFFNEHQKVDCIILAVPSSSIEDVLNKISKYINTPTILLNTSKGLYGDKFWKDVFSNINKNFIYTSINGPSFAIEMIKNEKTICDVFADSKDIFQIINNIFDTKNFKVNFEIASRSSLYISSFKNVLAIGMGIIKSITNSNNSFTSIIVLAIKETISILEEYLNDKINIVKYSSLGDILLTATNKESRNFSFGQEIYKFGIQQAKINFKNITVEGLVTIEKLKLILKETKNPNNFIFFDSLIKVINNELEPKEMLNYIWHRI